MQNADVILTIGSNNVENHPVSSKWVQRALDNGATWIVVDPRYTRSAEMADIYCPIRSGTDIAFYGGLFNYILEHDLWQHEYVLNYTNASYLLDEEYSFDVETGIFSGFDKDSATYDAKTWHYQVESTKEWDTSEGGAYAWAKAEGVPEFTPPTVEVPKRDMTLQDPMCVFQQMKKHYSRYDLDTVSATCGMDKELLEKVYATYAATGAPDKSGTILYALGQTQHTYGAQNCRSMGILQLLLGNVGVAGGGVNALRGEPNVQGATDMGMLVANQPGYLNWPTEYGTPSLRKWCEKETYADGYYTNKPKFIVSALKEWFGDAATVENDYGYDWWPKVPKSPDYSIIGAEREQRAPRHGEPRLARGGRLGGDGVRHLLEGPRHERRRHRHHGVLPARGADLREAGHYLELWPLAAVALPGRRAVGRRQARLRDLRRVVEGHRRPVQEGRRCGSRARRQHEVGLLR